MATIAGGAPLCRTGLTQQLTKTPLPRAPTANPVPGRDRVYDLPGRDCAASRPMARSRQTDAGLTDTDAVHRSDSPDLNQFSTSNIPVVAIIEPGLASNVVPTRHSADCARPQRRTNEKGTTYALNSCTRSRTSTTT